MAKRITFNFWRIEMPQLERRPFERLIEEANRVTGLQNRLRPLGGYPVRAERIEAAHSVWIGEMLKLRMDEIPAKAGLNTPIADLGLGLDEGVGEPNGFLFDPRMNILITHGEHFGVSAGKMVEYFADVAQSRGPIHVEPVLTEDAWRKFSRLSMVKAISYKIGRNINPSLLTGSGHSLSRSLRIIGDYDGLQMEVRISVGRSRTHRMDKERLEGDISALMACYDENKQSVQKLSVSGINSEGTTEEVDFLEGRMKVTIDVDLGVERRLTYDRRKIQLFQALRKRSEELGRIYGAVGEE